MDDLDLLDRVARDGPFHVATHRGDAFPVRDASARAAAGIRARPAER